PAVTALGIDPALFAVQTRTLQYLVRAQRPGVPVRRLLIQTALGEPRASETRVAEPHGFCATVPGVRLVPPGGFVDFQAARPGEEKVLILQRAFLNPDGLSQLRALLAQDYLLIAEIDDAPLRWPVNQANGFFGFRCCHAVQTSTEPLAAFLRT